MIWWLAHTPEPTKGLHPLNFGWFEDDDGDSVPKWFEGRSLLNTLTSDKDSRQENVLADKLNVMFDAEVDPYDLDASINEGTKSDDTDFEMLEYDSEPWNDDNESDCEDND